VALENLGLGIPDVLGDSLNVSSIVGRRLGDGSLEPVDLIGYQAGAFQGLLLERAEHGLDAMDNAHHDPGTDADTSTHDEPVSLFFTA